MRKITPVHVLVANVLFWIGLGAINLFRSYALGVTGSSGAEFDWTQRIMYSLAFNGSLMLLSIPLYFVYQRLNSLTFYKKIISLLFAVIAMGLIHVPFYFFFLGLYRPDLVDAEGGLLQFVAMEFSFNYPLMIGYAIFYGFVVICLMGIDYYNQYVVEKNENDAMRNQLRDAHLQNLKMKLHPHFLFNSLNTVSMMIVKDKKDTAMEFLEELGELLRKSLTDDDRVYVTLKEEMEFIDQYLNIEKIRFGDRLRVTIHIAPETEQIVIPHLILQPLIENAFKHGFSKTLEEGVIKITTSKEGSLLSIRVFNNGPLLPEEWVLEEKIGTGLGIVIDRLESAYEDAAACSIKNEDDQGVMVELTIPIDVNGKA